MLKKLNSAKLQNTRWTGIFSALIGASLFGVSGTVSSILFITYNVPYTALVTFRMLVSGGIALVVLRPKFPRNDIPLFLIFAVAGLFGVQYTYLAAIFYSNAPTATLLQYMFFPMVMGYEALRKRIRNVGPVILSLIVALIGIYELTTSFPYHSTSIILDPLALIFGLLSALTAALYTILSGPLMRKNGSVSVISWSLFIGGLFSSLPGAGPLVEYFTHTGVIHLPYPILLFLFVAIFGTLLAFGLYIRSMEQISATQASISATMEPITAAVSSAILVGTVLTFFQYVGGFLIILAIFIATFFSDQASGIKN